MVGTILNHYRIVRALGGGGMGEVYLAEDTRLHREIALKVLPQAMGADPERRQRFAREAQAIAALNHPNIVTVHSVEEADDRPFLTMELVDGPTLAEIIPRQGMPLDRLLKLAIPMADAVSAAHQRGITHRDLKPANIMVTDEGRVKVLDFGLAKLKEETRDASDVTSLPPGQITGEGRILGTAAYMSPEQAEGKAVDHRSDLFSLGIILYEMATGERPFKGDTSVSVLSSILKDSPRSVTELNPSLPSELGRIIRHSLAKDPTRRYQTAADLRNELEELKQELESGQVATDTLMPVAPAARASTRALWLLGGGVAILLLIGAGLWVRSLVRSSTAAVAQPVQASFTQLTSQAGQETFPSLSPDGKWIVYAGAASGNSDIYLQSVGGQTSVDLTRDVTANDTEPAFSPDGERIAFRSERQGGGIFVMGRLGESARRITDSGFNPSWSPDGGHIVFASASASANPTSRGAVSELWVVDVATGERRRLTEGDAVQPHWSPHGHRIAYWASSKGAAQRDIWTIPTSGGEAVSVTSDAAIDWSPVWSPDGKHLYFASDRGGSMNLWRVPIDEVSGKVVGLVEPITAPSPYVAHLSIAADGRRLAFASIASTRNVQKARFDSGKGTIDGEAEAVTSGSRIFGYPDPSPDGQSVVFASSFSNQQEDIFVSRSDGTDLRQLTSDPALDRWPRWSPDGRSIAFYSNRGGAYDIWTIHPDGSGLRQLTNDAADNFYPVWSPDGSHMGFTDQRGSKKIFTFDPGRPWNAQTAEALPAHTVTLRAFSWSLDGRLLACDVQGQPGGVVVYSFESHTYEQLSDSGFNPAWLPDSHRLLYTSPGGTLLLADRSTRASRAILEIPGQTVSNPRPTRDGRVIYFDRGTSEADIWLVTMK